MLSLCPAPLWPGGCSLPPVPQVTTITPTSLEHWYTVTFIKNEKYRSPVLLSPFSCPHASLQRLWTDEPTITTLSGPCSFSSSYPCSCCLLSTCSLWQLSAKQNTLNASFQTALSCWASSETSPSDSIMWTFQKEQSPLDNSFQRYYPWNWDLGLRWHHSLLALARVMATKVVFVRRPPHGMVHDFLNYLMFPH